MMRGIESGKEVHMEEERGRQCMDCIWNDKGRCGCLSKHFFLSSVSQGFTCTQEEVVVNSQEGRLCVSHQTHTIDLSHKSDVKH